jgi:2-amino-4-hydroxy-6-hydroxymethyldihydropteridine diphosphokinase
MYITKEIKKDYTVFSSKHFPSAPRTWCNFRHRVIIGIGGNVGDTKRLFEHLFWYCKREKSLQLCQTSSILKNPPFGYLNQAFFYNAVLVVQTNLAPRNLLRRLWAIEKRFGRKRSFQDAPRTLDLDILFYDTLSMHTKELTIPHKEWYKRDSVLIPLMEVNI